MPKSVLVVGCGVFGLSTALELLEQGYEITAIDKYEPPSLWSAANDFNKIIRAEYTDIKYSKLAIEAIHLWRTSPLFSGNGIYNECGRLMITPSHHSGRQEFERIGIENLKALGEGANIRYFKGGDEISTQFKHFKYNSITKTDESKFNPESGLGHAANSLVSVYERCKKLGGKFVFGVDGEADHIKVDKNGHTSIITKNGSVYSADQIIIAMGANTERLVDLKSQQSATGLFVTHIELTPDEYEFYKDLPVLFDAEMGYFFPPDPATRILKIALPGSGTSNFVSNPHGRWLDSSKISLPRWLDSSKISLPRFHNDNPTDTMPLKSIKQAKVLLAKYIPELAYHDLFNSKICWIADTQDSNFIIDKVPNTRGLFVATGDSGHAYKFLPNIGKYIVQKLERKLDPELDEAWKWKENAPKFDPTQCAWRVVDDFPDLSQIEWVKENSKSKL